MARNALGRGLSALIREPGLANPVGNEVVPSPAVGSVPAGGATSVATTATAAPALAPGSEVVVQVDIDLISPSPHQPRMAFDETALGELAQSITASGIIQPVLLRRTGNRYQLIAGERRWRAAQQAGLHRIPAIVRDVPDGQAVEMTLIENLQREDLNPLEEAAAYNRLMHEFGMTQDQVAERTGKSRSAISNTLRILRLEPEIHQLIASGKLSGSHARALAAIVDPPTRVEAAKKAARGRLTVRQIERMTHKGPKEPRSSSVDPADPNVKHMLGLMEQKYGTKIVVKPFIGGKGGQLIFYYYENEYLGTLYEMLMVDC